MKTEIDWKSLGWSEPRPPQQYCDMHQPLEFTPEELQRMDDDRGEREVYRMEDAREDNSNPPAWNSEEADDRRSSNYDTWNE